MTDLIKYLFIGIIFYILFAAGKEGFALTSDIVASKSALDPNKFYFKGTRKVSNTVTPAANGGAGCQEFPDEVYKVAPPTNAVCKGDNSPDYYTFTTTALQGYDLNPKKFVSPPAFIRNRAGKRCMNAFGSNYQNGTKVGQYGGGNNQNCENGNNSKWMYDGNNIISVANPSMCVYHSDGNNGAQIILWQCRASQAPNGKPVWSYLPDGAFINNETGKALTIFNNDKFNDREFVQWDYNGGVNDDQKWDIMWGYGPNDFYNFG